MRAVFLRALALVAITSLSIACGGAEPAPASPTSATPPVAAAAQGEAATGHADGKGSHDEHGKMKPALHDLHETLAPIWHAPAGTERIGKACSGEKDLRAKATAVADAELMTDMDALKAACDKADKAEVEAKLSTVHDRFHKLVEAK